jgi:flotillin
VKAEEVQVQIIEKQKQIELQQQEIMRKQRELEANVQKPADAERYKVETLANARKFQLETEAQGTASAAKATGFASAEVARATGLAEAEANKARGLAEAAIIEAQGKAQAEAMRQKAESFKEYNQAAVLEMIVRVLPEIAARVSEPLSKMEKMVIINSGNGPGGGASKLTADVTQIIAQLPPVLESLTGIKFEKLLEQVPALRNAMAKQEEVKVPVVPPLNLGVEPIKPKRDGACRGECGRGRLRSNHYATPRSDSRRESTEVER